MDDVKISFFLIWIKIVIKWKKLWNTDKLFVNFTAYKFSSFVFVVLLNIFSFIYSIKLNHIQNQIIKSPENIRPSKNLRWNGISTKISLKSVNKQPSSIAADLQGQSNPYPRYDGFKPRAAGSLWISNLLFPPSLLLLYF